MEQDIHRFPFGHGAVFHELVDARPAVQPDIQCRHIYGNAYRRIYPSLDVGYVDKPYVEE